MLQKFLFQALVENQLENQGVLKKFKLLEEINKDKAIILTERLDSLGDDQIKALNTVGDDKKELNRLTAEDNGITVGQLIASPNYEHLIEEYKLSFMIRFVRNFMNCLNNTTKELDLNINFSENEIITIEKTIRQTIKFMQEHENA